MAESGSLTVYPSAYLASASTTGLTPTNTSNPVGKSSANTSGYAQFKFNYSNPLTAVYGFDVSAIPANAEIDSVSCTAGLMYSVATTANLYLYSGSTSVASQATYIPANGKRNLTVSGGAWTRDMLSDIRLVIKQTSSNSTQVLVSFYGADLTVTYTYNNEKFMLRLTPSSDENILPEGYARLKYIECTGAQYADLGFKPNQDTRVVMDCQAYSVDSGGSFPFGVRAGLASKAFAVALTDSQVFYNYASNYQFADFSGITERVTIDANKTVATFEGSATVTVSLASGTFTCDSNLLVGTFGNNGTPSVDVSAWNGSIWSCQAYDNGALIRDCYPCLNPNGVPGLYDIVNGVFYGSATSTPFVAGPEYNDVWHDVARVFKKVNGIWVEQTDLANVVDQTKRLVNGGEYVAPVVVTIGGSFYYEYSWVKVNGNRYTSAASVEVEPGTEVQIYTSSAFASLRSSCGVKLNGTAVLSGAGTYTHIADRNCTITMKENVSDGMAYYSAEITTG